MQSISLPKSPKYTQVDENHGSFVIEDCYPGYGTTLGNALRRVLLSSLQGTAIKSVKIKGVSHEFSTIDGVMEDVIQIILNLKKIRFRMEGEESVRVSLTAKGDGLVTAKSIKCPAGIEVVNVDQQILTISDKDIEVEMEMEVDQGIGYIPVEQREEEEKEIGVIAIDAIYTPVRRVNYEVENMRVGKRTDYDKITLDIVTDGSSTPEDVFHKASQILVEQFSALLGLESGYEEAVIEEAVVEEVKEKKVKKVEVDMRKVGVNDIGGIGTRTVNVLESNDITIVGDIVKLNEDELKALDGMGDKGVKEIKKAIGLHGLTLKSK
ncbi:DNA-directed RNA polymerase subunit alpha [Patescibacteria group bacterium]